MKDPRPDRALTRLRQRESCGSLTIRRELSRVCLPRGEFFSLGLKSIPYAGFGDEVAWARGIALEFLTKLADVDA